MRRPLRTTESRTRGAPAEVPREGTLVLQPAHPPGVVQPVAIQARAAAVGVEQGAPRLRCPFLIPPTPHRSPTTDRVCPARMRQAPAPVAVALVLQQQAAKARGHDGAPHVRPSSVPVPSRQSRSALDGEGRLRSRSSGLVRVTRGVICATRGAVASSSMLGMLLRLLSQRSNGEVPEEP